MLLKCLYCWFLVLCCDCMPIHRLVLYADGNICANETGDGECQPLCEPSCQNGICLATGECSCLAGCKPTSEPNVCKCYPGDLTNTNTNPLWAKIDKIDTKCLPGYIKSGIDTCEPKCSKGCLHGFCKSPEVCECNPGFHFDEVDKECKSICDPGYKTVEGVCRPMCKYSCGKGNCVSPNVCECFKGYKIDMKKFSSLTVDSSPLCIPSCKNCRGECVAPNTCVTSTMEIRSSTGKSELYSTILLSPTTTSKSNIVTTRFASREPYSFSIFTPQTTATPSSIPPSNTPQSIDNPILSSETTTGSITSPSVTLPSSLMTTSRPIFRLFVNDSTTPLRTTTSASITPSSVNDSSHFSWITSTPQLVTFPSHKPRPTIDPSTTSGVTVLWSKIPSTKVKKHKKNKKTYKKIDQATNPEIIDSIPEPNSTKLETAMDRGESTWFEQHWTAVLLSVALILFAVILFVIVYCLRRNVHRSRNYVVKDYTPAKRHLDQEMYTRKKDTVEYRFDNC